MTSNKNISTLLVYTRRPRAFTVTHIISYMNTIETTIRPNN